MDELLDPLKETMIESELEAIRELLYTASYKAEKYGFMLGARFMAGTSPFIFRRYPLNYYQK